MFTCDFKPVVEHKFTFRTTPPQGSTWRGWTYIEVLEFNPPTRMVWAWESTDIDESTRVIFQLDPAVIHLDHRDVLFVAASRAPLDEIEPFKKRMGWTFPWVSSFETDFDWDFHVSFEQADMDAGEIYYNYRQTSFPESEAPGLCVFAKDDDSAIYHTYSTYGRGLDIFITAYNFLDHAPKGRDEQDLPYGMDWVRHHDRYED